MIDRQKNGNLKFDHVITKNLATQADIYMYIYKSLVVSVCLCHSLFETAALIGMKFGLEWVWDS